MTNVSHDIRTPLTTVLGYITMIKNGNYDSSEMLKSYVEIIERKGIFMATMLEDFFQFSKFASNDIHLNWSKFDLNELLRQMAEDEKKDFEVKGRKLETQLYSKSITVAGDAELLARVLENLLSNAKKYSRLNTDIILKSDVIRKSHHHFAGFYVSSIPVEEINEEDMKHFFERLYKKDDSRKEEGSGLGLAIAQQIIRLHDGKLEIKKENEKIMFCVYLRLADE